MSNAGHIVEGTIISAGAALLIADAFRGGGYRRIAANVLGGAGAVLGVGLLAGSIEHGGPVRFFRADAQQRQHLQMAGLLTAGGIAYRFGRIGGLLASLATARIGQMFLTHEQHGTGTAATMAKGKHDRLGRSMLGASALGALGEISRSRVLRAAGAIFLLGSGIQLILYREPEGTYEDEHGGATR